MWKKIRHKLHPKTQHSQQDLLLGIKHTFLHFVLSFLPPSSSNKDMNKNLYLEYVMKYI